MRRSRVTLPFAALLFGCGEAPLVVPNAPAECAGVAFTAPVGQDCVAPEHDVPGELAGAEGECVRTAPEGDLGSAWVVRIASREAAGEVRCVTSGCASPRFEIAESTATASPELAGTWLDEDGATCGAATFGNTGSSELAMLGTHAEPAWVVPNSPESCAGVRWTAPAGPGCPAPTAPVAGKLYGAEGTCSLEGVQWRLTLSAPDYRGKVFCETDSCRSDFYVVGEPDAAPSPGIDGEWVASNSGNATICPDWPSRGPRSEHPPEPAEPD